MIGCWTHHAVTVGSSPFTRMRLESSKTHNRPKTRSLTPPLHWFMKAIFFNGLRVLPSGAGVAFHRPRETRLLADDPLRPSIISIYGGKLTGYRATAARVMRRLQRALPQRQPRADTAKIHLQN